MQPGIRFGRLITLEALKGGKFWLCKCDCGNTTRASKWHLEKGTRKSCGCRKKIPSESYCCMACGQDKPRSEFYERQNKRIFYAICKPCYCEKQRKREQSRRLKALLIYGGDPPKCACPGCNEDHIEFLHIDHENNDGHEHRKLIGKRMSIWKWLEKNKYPTDLGLRVLCANCNLSRSCYGYCPHENDDGQQKGVGCLFAGPRSARTPVW